MQNEELKSKKISFIGAGIIAGVFIERLINSGIAKPDNILATDIKQDQIDRLHSLYGIKVSTTNKDGVDFGDLIIIATPPNAVKTVLSESFLSISEQQVIISLAAAVPTWFMEGMLNKQVPIIRVIPNTPSLVGQGMNPYCVGKYVNDDALKLAESFLDIFGKKIRIEESMMNVITALTAVGPTYIFPIIQALIEVSTKLGLKSDDAKVAAAQTVLVAASLVLETNRSPEDLKHMIATRTLKEDEAKALFMQAVEEAFSKVSSAEKKIVA